MVISRSVAYPGMPSTLCKDADPSAADETSRTLLSRNVIRNETCDAGKSIEVAPPA
jgi:hypothetical protein